MTVAPDPAASAQAPLWRWLAGAGALVALGAVSGYHARRLADEARPAAPTQAAPAAEEKAAALLEGAAEAEGRGDHARAAELRREFLEAFPASWRRHPETLARARGLARAGRPDDGIRLLQSHAASGVESGQAHVALAAAAEIARSAGDPERALSLLRLALRAPVTRGVRQATELAAAEGLVTLDRGTEALEALEALAREGEGREPGRARAWITVLRARTGAERPAGLADWRRLAFAHGAVGDRAGAERAWSEAERAGPLEPADLLERAANLAALGEKDGAARVWTELFTRHPGHPLAETALLRWAKAQAQDRSLRAARTAYLELLARFPRGTHAVEAWLGLGDVEVGLEHHGGARKAYGEALARARTPAQQWAARIAIGWCHLRERDPRSAIQHFEGLLRLGPAGEDRAAVRWALASARLAAGQREPAAKELRALLAESPASPLARKARAVLSGIEDEPGRGPAKKSGGK